MRGMDTEGVRDRANGDPGFGLAARWWSARVGFDMGDACYELRVRDGKVQSFTEVAALTGAFDIRIGGPADAWDKLLAAVPPPRYDDIRFGGLSVGFTLEGSLVDAVAPYYGAIQAFVAAMREVRSGSAPQRPVPDATRAFDTAVGRYAYVDIEGTQYRVYVEQAGDGPVPMILQHTAGADSRQWRHVLEDPDYQQRCTMVAYDLPFHGKSLPPTSRRWWESEYRLTRSFLMGSVLAVSRAVGLDRPVYMGCSIGGHLAPDLAFYHPDDFRAVIGINAGLATPIGGDTATEDSWFHPRVASDWKAAAMYGNTAPTSPEAYRRETTWIYSQGGPPVLRGDIHYYSRDHDLTAEQAARIDTARVGVYLLTGEYDFLAGEAGTAALAACIAGSEFRIIPGMGHFGPAENPEDFKPALLDILQRLA